MWIDWRDEYRPKVQTINSSKYEKECLIDDRSLPNSRSFNK